MKQKIYYQFAPIMGVIVLIIASLACASSAEVPIESPKISTATPDTEKEELPNITPESESTAISVSDLYLGDTVENYGYALTGISVQDPATPGRLYTPEEGTKFVAVEIVVSNIFGNVLSVNPLNATLVDSEGFTYQAKLGGAEEQISTLDLSIGEKVRGVVAFQVPTDAVPASIKFSVERFGNKILQASLAPPPEGHEPISETPGENPTLSLPKLGDVVEQFGYSITAVTVEDPAKAGRRLDVKQGYKLVAVEIIVGNVSGNTLSVNPLRSYLIDSNGFVYTVELGGRDGQIATTDINSGEKVKGWVAFMIPEDAIPAGVKYQVQIFSSNYLLTGLGE